MTVLSIFTSCASVVSSYGDSYVKIYQSKPHLNGADYGLSVMDYISIINNEMFYYERTFVSNKREHSAIIGTVTMQNDTLILTPVFNYKNGKRTMSGSNDYLGGIPLYFKKNKNSIIDITKYKDYAAHSDAEWEALSTIQNDSIAISKFYESLTPFDYFPSDFSLGEFKLVKRIKDNDDLRRIQPWRK